MDSDLVEYHEECFSSVDKYNNRINSKIDDFLAHNDKYFLLNLSRLNLLTIPPAIEKLKGVRIKTMDFQGNLLQEIPPFFKNIEVKEIILSSNKLGVFPENLNPNITSLYIGSNNLHSIPKWIDKYQNLEVLSLGNNYLTTLPSTFKNLKNLEKLDISSNNFSQIPEQIYDLKKLRLLNIENNSMTEIDDRINKIPALENLYFDGNPIRDHSFIKSSKINYHYDGYHPIFGYIESY